MVVDTSAFIAIIFKEPTRIEILRHLYEDGPSVMSAPNVLECHMVLAKHYGPGTDAFIREQLRDLDISIVAFTPEHAEEAARAFDRYGKGRHPASLNFGDCIAYALSKVSGQKLLYVGEDFTLTDVRPAYRA